ncbi:MAG: chemotaxis protein CheW [Bryobacterales bacterium]|nr:chemotaxis protein CheW [Acidobacteriota bacterium]MCB9383139.1 chemotaxis protein CheW [Bryobacterales bacterium]
MRNEANNELRRSSRQYATFVVHDLFLGVDVLKVQEVLRYQQMTPVPRADGVIEGLINLRGQIVTAFDMRRRLGLPDRPAEREPMNVVIRADDGAVSLLVDEIGDVIEVDSDDFEPPPETISRAAREVIEGVYKLSDRLLLVLSSEKALRS